MTEIARRAGVSPGNIYHYFPGKEALFADVVPAALVRRFRRLLRQRLAAARGVRDLRAAPAGSSYPVAAGETLEFALEHRLEVVILLGRTAGTPHAGVGEEVVATLVEGALRYVSSIRPGPAIGPALRFDLEEIYRSYMKAWVRILGRFREPAEIRQALAAYERYHLAGLRAFFG
jgi:AcrR family transcriptional regulator